MVLFASLKLGFAPNLEKQYFGCRMMALDAKLAEEIYFKKKRRGLNLYLPICGSAEYNNLFDDRYG